MPQQPRFGAVHFQGALMCCEDHDREPCPHDPARRCEGCPGGSTAATVAQAAPAAVAEPSGNAMRAAQAIQLAIKILREDMRAMVDCHAHPDTGVIPADEPEARAAFDRYCAAINGLEALAAAPAAAQPVAQEAAKDDADRQLLRELFSVCEATEDEHANSEDSFKRGQAFEAKRIRRAVGTWYQDTFCGPSFMGEPVIATPPALVGLSHPRDKPHSRYIDGYGYVSNMALDAIQRALAAANGMTLREDGNG